MDTSLPNYRIYDRTGGGVTHDIRADTLDEAIEAGRDWIENGDWSGCSEGHDDSDVIARVRSVELECEVGEIVYRPTEPHILPLCSRWDLWSPEWDTESKQWRIDVSDIADEGNERVAIAEAVTTLTGGEWDYEPVGARCIWTPPADVEMEEDEEATNAADTHDCSGTYTDAEPDCSVDEGWDFVSTVTAGLDEFGCRSHGGTAMTHYEVCRNTGVYRETMDPGCQRNSGEPTEIVTYRERDKHSEAYVVEHHTDDDGFLPEWLATYLDRSLSTRMTEEQAREWVAEHGNDDELDAEELEHAFAAIFGRRANDQERTEGVWSHLNA